MKKLALIFFIGSIAITTETSAMLRRLTSIKFPNTHTRRALHTQKLQDLGNFSHDGHTVKLKDEASWEEFHRLQKRKIELNLLFRALTSNDDINKYAKNQFGGNSFLDSPLSLIHKEYCKAILDTENIVSHHYNRPEDQKNHADFINYISQISKE